MNTQDSENTEGGTIQLCVRVAVQTPALSGRYQRSRNFLLRIRTAELMLNSVSTEVAAEQKALGRRADNDI